MQSAEEIIGFAIEHFGSGLALSTSFQKGGIIVLDMAVRISPSIRVLTIDTGRLPEETYAMIESVRKRYGIRVEMIYPDAAETAEMVNRYGPNLFYVDQPSRMVCCHVRKVRPLERKVTDIRAILTGLRRDQSEGREMVDQIDESGSHVKISPLAHWTIEDVDRYTILHELPVHPLYAKGYTSIGCAPCTRATSPGEDPRAGRWWWEASGAKECGLHVAPDGRLLRTVDVMLHDIERNR